MKPVITSVMKMFSAQLISMCRSEGIENHLYWHQDVTFWEDDSRARRGNVPENLSTLRKLALQIIKEHKDKLNLKKRRLSIPNRIH